MKSWESNNSTGDWNNIGGCFAKHPFNKANRAACEQAYLQKQALDPKAIQAQSDYELAKAAGSKAAQSSAGTWTAGQTALVAIGSLLAIGLVAVVIIKAKKKK